MTSEDTSGRTKFRFTLRQLLISVTIGCVVFGWLVNDLSAIPRRRAMLAEFAKFLCSGSGYPYYQGAYTEKQPPFLLYPRIWFDEPKLYVEVPYRLADQEAHAKKLFPEATVTVEEPRVVVGGPHDGRKIDKYENESLWNSGRKKIIGGIWFWSLPPVERWDDVIQGRTSDLQSITGESSSYWGERDPMTTHGALHFDQGDQVLELATEREQAVKNRVDGLTRRQVETAIAERAKAKRKVDDPSQ